MLTSANFTLMRKEMQEYKKWQWKLCFFNLLRYRLIII